MQTLRRHRLLCVNSLMSEAPGTRETPYNKLIKRWVELDYFFTVFKV